MNIQHADLIVFLSFSFTSLGQPSTEMPQALPPKPAFSSQGLPDPSLWPIEWSSSGREFLEWITNSQTGEVATRNHNLIAVGNGLNFINSNGVWQASENLIELTPSGGAAALRLPNNVFFGPTLSTTNGLGLLTMSNLVFNTAPLGVYFICTMAWQAP